MEGKDRRKDEARDLARLRAGLNAKQLSTIATMQHLGWTLRFVRRPLFLEPVPVMFDRAGRRSAVIEPDGTANGDHGLKLRD